MTDDDELLARLDTALTHSEPDDRIAIELGEAAFEWRTLDAELADLTADSATLVSAAVRSGEQPRLMTFEGLGITIELEVEQQEAQRRVVGQLSPVAAAEVAVRIATGTEWIVEADTHGHFAVDGIPAGATSFRVRTLSGRTYETAWLMI